MYIYFGPLHPGNDKPSQKLETQDKFEVALLKFKNHSIESWVI